MEFVDLVGFEPTSCMINSSPHIVPQRMAKLPMDAARYEILRQLEIPKLIQDSVWANYILFDKTHFKTGPTRICRGLKDLQFLHVQSFDTTVVYPPLLECFRPTLAHGSV